MAMNTMVYSILSTAIITLMFMFVFPLLQKLITYNISVFSIHLSLPNVITGLLTVVLIAPFLRAMVMKKNHSEEWKALWHESNRNRLPLIFTVIARIVIAVGFIFYICNYLSHTTPALMITLGVLAVAFIIFSRTVKHRSILLERLFINNLRSRDIAAQVSGQKRPLYEGRLLDRDIHIAYFDIPQDSQWAGRSLRELNLGRKYGVHVSSILRGRQRLNIPDGETRLYPLDRIQVIGSDQQLSLLAQAVEKETVGEDPDIERREMKLRQLIITKKSPFIGKTLQESGIRDKYGCMVVGLEEGEENLSMVKADRCFTDGDIIWVVGEQSDLDSLLKA